MIAPVDVLDVLDRICDSDYFRVEGIHELRAAVAELIDIGSRMNWQSHADNWTEFHAALARVKGGA